MTAAWITEVVDLTVPDHSPLFAPAAPGLIRNEKVGCSIHLSGTKNPTKSTR
jgi:hypothetical protein